MEIIVVTILFILVLAYPLISKKYPQLSDMFYEWRIEYNRMKGKRKAWNLFIKKSEPFMAKGLVTNLERLLRLAGRPWGIRAQELLVIQGVILIGVGLLATQTTETPEATLLLAILLSVYPIKLLMTKKDRRQLEASEAIRFLKRRFIFQLRQNIPLDEALKSIAEVSPGDFGRVFRGYVDQLQQRSLREVMSEFRQEYEVRSLDEFCIAIELSDQKSPEILADLIYRQTMDESARIDEYINQKTTATKGKMIGVVAATAIWVLGFTIYFGYYGFIDNFRGGGGFLFF